MSLKAHSPDHVVVPSVDWLAHAFIRAAHQRFRILKRRITEIRGLSLKSSEECRNIGNAHTATRIWLPTRWDSPSHIGIYTGQKRRKKHVLERLLSLGR